ncbi:HMA2 domain-containing protein [Pseudoleptotrichia goodfellowii]|uniref:Uncharacterized protein n=1 Tax=Pseudoleptotrichia goodfellowii TaxID=157692 RepID=A0A510JED9_9FUSO|nr:hypothetical protein [Pseudoleptotrichia goodfellowii]BBM36403.1 hypothetical protein JCM16774_1335 [Pseudoleptotrichia goodfellowii]
MLPDFYGVIEVKHYQKGRLRLQTQVLKENFELKKEFLENINRIEGIVSADVNSVIGSILILFDENKIESSFLYLVILKILHLEEEAFKSKPTKIKIFLKNVFEVLDLSVYNKSKGLLDIKTIVAGLFTYYGIESLRGVKSVPSGISLLWWAYILVTEGKNENV